MTRLGISTFAYAWAIGVSADMKPAQPMDHLAFIRRCGEHGVRVAQIADNLPLHPLDAEALSALVDEARRLNIALEVGTRGIAPDHLRRYLHIAQRCHSPVLRVVIDTAEHQPDTAETLAILRPLLPEFADAGVILAIENHDRFPARVLRQLIEDLDSAAVGICLDTANSFGAMEGIEVVVDVLGPYVVNLHVKDYVIRRNAHNLGFLLTGTAAGQGMLDIPWLLGRLDAFGCDYNAILELWTLGVADPETMVRQEAEWVRQSVSYLRGLIPDQTGKM